MKNQKDTYTIFINGARDGMSVILKVFPTMVGILVAINLFQVTGAVDIFLKIISPITNILKIPSEHRSSPLVIFSGNAFVLSENYIIFWPFNFWSLFNS